MADGTRAEHVAAVVLAAGLGTRFKSDLAKVMHEAAGRTMLRHILAALEPLALGQVVIVVGHQADEVTSEAERSGIERLETAFQQDQLGTGHAAAQALPVLYDAIEHVIVLPGDAPLLRPETLEPLIEAPEGLDGVLLTAELEDPSGYGRVVRGPDGNAQRIVEEADATEAERAIREVNVGMYRWRRSTLEEAVGRLDEDNAQGEQERKEGKESGGGMGGQVQTRVAPAEDVAGVNDRIALADAASVIRRRVLERLMADGVTVIDPATTYVEVDVSVGRDTTLLPGTILEGRTRVGDRAVIGPYTRLVDATVGDEATVEQAVVLEAEIGPEASVGPFAYLRPGSRIDRGGKVGTYVELKKTTVGEGAKVPHLSYMGDAEIGAGANIGAGTITCNYDGFDKHRTEVGEGAFVGSDTMLIAPVRIGDGAFTGAGSAIAEDVPDDALAVERSEQRNLEGWAAKKREQHPDG